MKCNNERIQELIPLYHDGNCTNSEKQAIEEHIKTCESCKEEFDLYATMADAFKLEDIELPVGFHENMMERLETEDNQTQIPKKQAFYIRNRSYMNVAAMLVFVILLSVIGLTKGNEWFESSYVAKDEANSEGATAGGVADDSGEMNMISEESQDEMITEETVSDNESVKMHMSEAQPTDDSIDEEIEKPAIDIDSTETQEVEEGIELRDEEYQEGSSQDTASETLNTAASTSESLVESDGAIVKENAKVQDENSGSEATNYGVSIDSSDQSGAEDKNDEVSIKAKEPINLNGNGKKQASSNIIKWLLGGLGLFLGGSILIYWLRKK